MSYYKRYTSTTVDRVNGLVKVGHLQSGDAIDFGWVGEYDTGTTAKYAGIFRDADDGVFKLFEKNEASPFASDTVNTGGTNYTPAKLEVGQLDAGNLRLAGNVISSTSGNITITPDGTGQVLLKEDPISSNGWATKQYVDNNASVDGKKSVVAATTQALSGTESGSGAGKTITANAAQQAFTVDGVTLIANERVLVKNGVGTGEIFTFEFTAAESTNNYDNKYWTFTAGTTDYRVWYNVNTGGSDPGGAGTPVEVAIALSDSVTTIAANTVTALLAADTGSVNYISGSAAGVVTVKMQAAGNVTDVANVNVASPTVNVSQQGTASSDVGNGIYTVTTVGTASTNWVLTRATDFDTNALVTDSAFTFTEEGTSQSDSGWVVTSNDDITVDTSSIVWLQFTVAGQYGGTNVGSGTTTFRDKTGSTLNIRSLIASSVDVTGVGPFHIVDNTDDFTFAIDFSDIINVAALDSGSITTTFGDITTDSSVTAQTITNSSGGFSVTGSAFEFLGASTANQLIWNSATTNKIKDVDTDFITAGSSRDLQIGVDTQFGSGFSWNTVNTTGDDTLDADSASLFNITTSGANATVTLSSDGDSDMLGRVIRVVKVNADAFSVIIDPTGAEPIDGVVSDTIVLDTQWDHVSLVCLGDVLGWVIV